MDIPKVGDVCISKSGNLYRIGAIFDAYISVAWLGMLLKCGRVEKPAIESTWNIERHKWGDLTLLDLM